MRRLSTGGWRGLLALALLSLSAACPAELTQQHLEAIQKGLRYHPLFKDLKLGDVPESILPHWVELQDCASTPFQLFPLRQQKGGMLRQHVFEDLKEMNWAIANANEQPTLGTDEQKRACAVRYCHLLFCLSQCYETLNWKRYELDSDFAHTGWNDAAACRWMQNYMTARSWLGATQVNPANVANADANAGGVNALPGGMTLTGGRSVKDVEAAIRNQERYLKDLERQLDRASANYSSLQSSERERYARDGRPTSASLITSALSRVHNYERLLRENQRRLDELNNELEAAQARERQQTAQAAATPPAAAPAAGAEAAPAAPGAAGTPSGKCFCTQCGAKAAANANYCGACGTKL